MSGSGPEGWATIAGTRQPHWYGADRLSACRKYVLDPGADDLVGEEPDEYLAPCLRCWRSRNPDKPRPCENLAPRGRRTA